MNNQPNRFQDRALRDYQEARHSPAYHQVLAGESTDEPRQAALGIAQAIGYCRLWGVDLGDQDGSVPKKLLPLIGETLSDRIRDLIQDLTIFEARMETVSTAEEEELLASNILRQRMDGWACWVAIDERVQMLVEEDQQAGVDALIQQAELGAVYHQWDVDLQARGDLLVAACDTYLLENWQNALSEGYSDAFPWWLDQEFWSQARTQPVPNMIRLGSALPSQADQRFTSDDSVGIFKFAEPWALAEPLVMAGATVGEEARRLEFSSSRDADQSAIARVTIPTRLVGDATITVDIRFRFVNRAPQSVGLGSIVSLGSEANGIVVRDFEDGQLPLYRASIRLTREDVQRIGLEQHVRFTVDRRDWIPRG